VKKQISHIIVCFVLCLIYTPLAAQQFELGNVTKEELQEKFHPADSTASAAVLYEKGRTYFDIEDSRWIIITEVVKRIKIYNKEGVTYGNVSVPYYTGKAMKEKVTFSDAVTYNLSNNEIVKNKVEKTAIFTNDASKTKKIKLMVMPNVVEGSVIEYKYIIRSPYIFSMPDWYFQSHIPVNVSEYTVGIPQMFKYNLIKNNYFPILENSEIKAHTIGFGRDRIAFNDLSITYSVANMPAFKAEAYIDNPQNYMSNVKHELASFKNIDGKEKNYTTDWSSVISTIYKEEGFGDELKKQSYFTEGLKPLLEGKKEEKEIISTVFNFVKERMAWNHKYGYDCNDNIKTAYETRTGNVGEINLMLTAMLKYAGLKANPVVLSTRENGYVSYMSVVSFNYVIAAVETGEGIILLDATDKNALPGILPIRAVNIIGRLIRDDMSSEEVSLLPQKQSKKVVVVMADIANDGTLSGKVKEKYEDYEAMTFRSDYHGNTTNLYTDNLKKQLKIDEITDLVIDESDVVSQEYAFVSKNECDVVNDRIYMEPMLFHTIGRNPFKEEERLYPVDFVYPTEKKYVYYIHIPEGYTVEHMPESVLLKDSQDIGTFRFNFAKDGNMIQVVVVNSINYARVSSEYYGAIKELYKNVITKQNEKIILKKA
jgi:hypothetical protein